MCFGSKLKSEEQSLRLNEKINHNVHINSRPVKSKLAGLSNTMSYQAPVGPPPEYYPNQNQSSEIYSAPQGPPPRHQDQHQAQVQEYAQPPPGPPPSHFLPPPGPPPGHSQPYDAPPTEPYHDWQTAVPDTSLLPPPPSMGNQRSSTNNATEEQAELGEIWCTHNPMTSPTTFPKGALEAIEKGEIGVIRPRDYKGDLERRRTGVWAGKTKANSPDSCIASTIPLYSVMAHSPLRTSVEKTIYYEVRINARNRREVSLAMGFGAVPYPTFRLPGWHRGCLAVHGDDGSKYINDRWGGKDFTQPFKAGETLGLGMTFRARDMQAPPSYDYAPAQTLSKNSIDVEIFFTRNGRKENSWNLHEEGDAQEDLPVTGLEGFNDLYAMVGTFENVEFEIIFKGGEWMYQP
ncbi:hypothetical protein QTJ16_003374 [Diplocarpon rosae]|uniref:SPRY domain-containing protein n=1 Tax=Diplocarpon rosae TaxID=946125 RepID=A0AAD9WEL2_9HELO|nr:hypothetical protein QTJ16_003374 [Diplocarpon rosae]